MQDACTHLGHAYAFPACSDKPCDPIKVRTWSWLKYEFDFRDTLLKSNTFTTMV